MSAKEIIYWALGVVLGFIIGEAWGRARPGGSKGTP